MQSPKAAHENSSSQTLIIDLKTRYYEISTVLKQYMLLLNFSHSLNHDGTVQFMRYKNSKMEHKKAVNMLVRVAEFGLNLCNKKFNINKLLKTNDVLQQ